MASIEQISHKVSLEKDLTQIQHLGFQIEQKDKRVVELEDKLDQLNL